MSDPSGAAPRPTLSVVDGVLITVGIVIGIGIFKTPSLVASGVTSEWAFIGVWLLGGIVTLVGALCYAELAAAHPHAGGEYHFLSRAFGRSLAVLFGWARGTVIQTGAIAAVAFVYGDYAQVLLPLGPFGGALHAGLAIAVFTALNYVGSLESKRAQIILETLTLATLAIVVLVGVLSGAKAPPPAAPSAGSGAIGMAMIFVLLTYGGWNEAAYLSAEMKDPQRNMVRVLVLATLAVTAIYVAVNLAFLSVFGLEGLRASQAVGADMMRLAAGDTGAILLSLCVVAAALSTLNATIFTGARVYYAMGKDLPLLPRLGLWDPRGHNPANAILLQGVIALALVAFGAATRGGFQAMVDYTAPVFWFFLLMVGAAVVVLRRREPDRALPFRVPLYPLTPALFCLTCLYMLYSSVAYTGTGALVGIAVVLAGLPLLLMNRVPREVPAE
ncbi:APC family permease [Salinarimonas soli]|uniref:Amino acid permease n=1 Tax=Salinarimonas soli TaxID=1638099 RepID=A0A5B2VV74_9HYPH|nr:amino acid permease [Salinarimonas soli]KAA2242147.1 amino acid permease [Salinarimonas soli]